VRKDKQGTIDGEKTQTVIPWQPLLRALHSPKPERDLVHLLEHDTGGTAAILAPWGELLAGTVTPGAARRDARDEGQLLGTVLLHAPAAHAALLDAVAEVYALAALRRQARVARAAAAGEALLAELVSGARAPDLPDRLALHGFEDESYVVGVLELPARRARSRSARHLLADDLERLRAAGDGFLSARGHRALSAVRGTRAVWLWATQHPAGQLGALLAAVTSATHEDVRLGVSAVHTDPREGDAAFREALLAVADTRSERSAALFTAMDPLNWVLSNQPREQLRLWRDALLQPLRAADEDGRLLETLRAYLRDPEHKGALAERLNVHPNTLRYRLARIEELLGQPLSHPATLARLYLALGPDA